MRADVAHGSPTGCTEHTGAARGGPFLELSEELWHDGFALKFYSAVRLSRLFWPRLVESHGAVVNIVGSRARTPAAATDEAAVATMTAEIQAAVKERKGPVQSPKQVVVVDSVPITALGKPDKKAVRKQFWEGAGRSVG